MSESDVKWSYNRIAISRQMAVEFGLVEPTPEERAEREREIAEWRREQRTLRGRLRRLRWWLRAHRPRVHFGACEDLDA